MLTFESFAGINNVQPPHRLGDGDLTVAENVDIGLTGEIRRRSGYAEVLATCHKNVWKADGFYLATVDGGDLIKMAVDGTSRVTLYPSLGASRVWYCNLPDGRTTFSNGLINGITDGATYKKWGVPVPATLGNVDPTAGDLFDGEYRYQLTYVRTSDGLEGAPTVYSEPIDLTEGGLLWTGLPTLSGYSINVYLTSHNGGAAFFAGNTTTSVFSFTGENNALVLPLRTDHLSAAPVGTVTAFWRGRVLVAQDSVLWASRTNQWESFDLRRDFKQFSAPITLIQPVDGGIFVGTEAELAFLSGVEFDKLAYTRVVDGPTVLGSGVSVRGERVKRGDGASAGAAMICIADGRVVAGYSDGGTYRMTEGRYHTDVTEVAATFRITADGIPQYIAIPQ